MILAQVEIRTAATDTTIYTAPEKRRIQKIFACNVGGGATAFILKALPKDETAANRHILYPSTALAANKTLEITGGITLGPGDSLVGQSITDVGICFTVFGE